MDKIVVSNEYFNPLDTLSCGQIFRYKQFNNGYLVISKDKICYIYNIDNEVVIQTEDKEYFYNFFDIDTDYSKIVNYALNYGNQTLTRSATLGKGIRILHQDPFEMLFTFIISQNNNIKRISSTVEKLCERVGTKLSSPFGDYYAFPSATQMSVLTEADYKEMGFGYRGRYFIELISLINGGFNVYDLSAYSDSNLKQALTSLVGVGEKVANCVSLFGYYRTSAFPVDTWIEKIYIDDFSGTLKDRKKITEWFENEFKEYSGYIQQYLFHYKRNS
ncbi:MAG: hypothetical protein IJA97_02470 [Clostridia bacterium]|nr:hypothetical protein [Clostridia bacterium]